MNIRTIIATGGLAVAGGLLLAPVAAADADGLTNVDVAGNAETTQKFTRFDTGIEPVLGTGGQGPYTHRYEPLMRNGVVVGYRSAFDDGLSDSSRDMLDRINGYD